MKIIKIIKIILKPVNILFGLFGKVIWKIGNLFHGKDMHKLQVQYVQLQAEKVQLNNQLILQQQQFRKLEAEKVQLHQKLTLQEEEYKKLMEKYQENIIKIHQLTKRVQLTLKYPKREIKDTQRVFEKSQQTVIEQELQNLALAAALQNSEKKLFDAISTSQQQSCEQQHKINELTQKLKEEQEKNLMQQEETLSLIHQPVSDYEYDEAITNLDHIVPYIEFAPYMNGIFSAVNRAINNSCTSIKSNKLSP